MTIGLFGGTFDPIHFGHLNLAIELKEKCHLKEVWFIPAGHPPLKEKPICSPQDRYEMVRLAIEEIPDVKVLDINLGHEEPSYTVNTIKKITTLHPDKKFSLLLGEDAALQFPLWKEPETILQMVSLLVACRSKQPSEIKIKICETNLFDISSTEVRKRLEEELYCGHLVPAKVLDYIYENQLYFNG